MCLDRLQNGSPIALKVYPARNPNQRVSFERFSTELSVASQIDHPHLIHAYDTLISRDFMALSMKYAAGGTLADYILKHGYLPISETVDLLGQMCEGVSALHQAGFVHHDLKPANILLNEDSQVMICDFTVSREISCHKSKQTNWVTGTAHYMSPEHLQQGVTDVRCDIYSLGAIAYEMLAGRPPFVGQNTTEIISLRLHSEPRPVYEFRPDCPIWLSNLVAKAMRRDPGRRFQSAQAMLRAVRRARRWLKMKHTLRVMCCLA